MTLSFFFVILGLISMAGVVASLFSGIFVMTRGREKDHKSSNKMMQTRVWLQGMTLLFFFLATVTK